MEDSARAIGLCSGGLLNRARGFAARREDAEVAILLAALGVEAFMNELSEYARIVSAPSVHALAEILEEAESARMSTLAKVGLAYYCLRSETIDKGSQPFQDVSLLMDLRNRIVHAKPERILFPTGSGATPDKPKIVSSLVSRGVITEPSNPVSAWRQYVLVPEVASWAATTAIEFTRWFASLPRDPKLRDVLNFVTTDR